MKRGENPVCGYGSIVNASRELLGLVSDWLVSEVKLSTEKNQVVIRLET